MQSYVSSSNLSGVTTNTNGWAFSSGRRHSVMSLREALLLQGFCWENLGKDSNLNTLSPDNCTVAFMSSQTVSADRNGRLLQMHKTDGMVLFTFPIVRRCDNNEGEFYFIAESFRIVVSEKGVLKLVHSA